MIKAWSWIAPLGRRGLDGVGKSLAGHGVLLTFMAFGVLRNRSDGYFVYVSAIFFDVLLAQVCFQQV